ncbi:MAG: DMT family transporter [Candidatus Eremiobacteraeota bacterium]|nr:DMT family transporter [Candidatus Eremiobacteraeota bacterium]
MQKAAARAYAILFGAQLAVGAAAIFARYALTGAEPLAVSALRLVIASSVLFSIALFRREGKGAVTKRQNVLLLVAGVALALHFAGWIWSLQFTSVAISTLLVCSSPIWTAAYDALVLRRPLARLGWLGFGAGAVGLTMVLSSTATPAPVPGHAAVGYALAISGSVAIAAYLILVREVRSQLSTRTIVTRTYSCAAATLTLAALFAHQRAPLVTNSTAWLGILAMALISQLLGHTGLNAALRFFSPSSVSFATLLEPIFAAVLAAIVFHEQLSAFSIAGGCIVLSAIAAVLYAEASAERS